MDHDHDDSAAMDAVIAISPALIETSETTFQKRLLGRLSRLRDWRQDRFARATPSEAVLLFFSHMDGVSQLKSFGYYVCRLCAVVLWPESTLYREFFLEIIYRQRIHIK